MKKQLHKILSKRFGARLVRLFKFRLRRDYWVFKKRPWLFRSFLALVILIFMAAGYGAYYLYLYDGNLVGQDGNPLDLDKLSRPTYKKTSYVFDARDNIIGKFFYEIREPVQYTSVPENMKNAFLAAEDKRFFSHHGYDPLAMSRALMENKLHHRVTSGASTITQQLVRHLYDEDVPEFHDREVSFSRKLKEVQLAIRIEQRYSKEKIFEIFLNYIYVGHGHYGIIEGARYYFSKSLQELTPPEAAMIAALNKSPEKFCPIHRPKEALERRNWVLTKMAEAGFISDEDRQQYLKQSLGLKVQVQDDHFGYDSDYVRRFLLEHNFSADDIWHNGGLRIHTTIDSTIQHIVSNTLKNSLIEYNKKFQTKSKQKIEGSVVVIDNETGGVVAISGGSDFAKTQLNRAVQTSTKRQPGSAFKPFTYVAALKQGMTIWDLTCDCAIRMPAAIDSRGNVTKWWTPKNFGGSMAGPVPIWNALAKSRNLATLNLAKKVGLDNVIETAHDMGIKSELPPYLPTAIGAADISLLELTSAYSTFPNMGIYREPFIVSEIKNSSDQTIYINQVPSPRRVFDNDVAVSMAAVLRSVTKVGTAVSSMRGISQEVAGKTGTTNDAKDVLFMGFTPKYTIGVRLGYDIPESLGSGQAGTGGHLAAPIFRKIIDQIYATRTKENFPAPVEVLLREIISAGSRKQRKPDPIPVSTPSVPVQVNQ